MSEEQEKYFEEYENLEVHELMLRDRPRQVAYLTAINNNVHMFKDKVVLDVGAGTGILSVFCAKAGARKVYAIEATNLAKIAEQIVEENDLTNIVTVIQSKVEECTLEDKVDIIISEWMGFYLLHEGMLDTVLYARDKFLKTDGCMFPNEASIYVAPCSVPSRFDDWLNVDGVSMNSFAKELRKQKSQEPEIAILPESNLLHEGVVMHWLNLQEITVDELETLEFRSVISLQKSGKHQGFCLWFEVRFPSEKYENTVVLNTGPGALTTHWKQCIITLPEPLCEELEEQTPIAFHIVMRRHSQNPRHYNLELEMLDANAEEHALPCDCHLTKCILTKAHLLSTQTKMVE